MEKLLVSEQPLSLTFENLSNNVEDYLLQEVEIRGFLYQTPSNKVILAANPQLKSCCMGLPGKLAQQIVLRGDWESVPQQAATISGRLIAEPQYNERNELVQLYVLEHPVIIHQSSFPVWSAIGIAILFIAAFVKTISTQRRKHTHK